MVVLSAALVTSTIVPAEAARGRGGGGGAYRGGGGGAYRGGGAYGGGARAAPQRNYQPAQRTVQPATRSGRVGNVNVDRSRDVNVQRNTVVRPAARGYTRAPYAHGGRRYYSHNAYRYHRYRPYSAWGPSFHPFGAFVATVAATAIVVSVANHQYRYNQGVWYAPSGSGYNVIAAPVGATVPTLPPNATVVTNNNYYYGGAYYEKTGDKYKVVAPQAGTVVDELPPGGEEVTVGEQKYVKFGETYYQPIEQNGKKKYEVVDVK